ncbi:MAG: hypothetical protein ABSG76_20125 [Xanthobacteraceae bacterium]
MRLDPPFRRTVYAVMAALLATGVAWIVADALKDSVNGEAWQQVAASLLMYHGGAAMVMLMLLGALVPLHVGRSWRAGRNRTTGAAMASLNAALVVTAFGLYYLGSDTTRPWWSGVHIGVGLALPLLVLVHVWNGRRLRHDRRR